MRFLKNLNLTMLAVFMLNVCITATAQDCGCTVTQVQTNTVAHCSRIIGEVVTVGSAGEIRAAIDRANTQGGNLTILIANGIYRIASSTSFPYLTASNVVIRSLSGNRDSVILEGGGMKDVSPATESGLLIAGSNVTIADLTIRGVGNHGVQVSAHHLLVHNVRIQNTYQQMLKGATDRASIDSGVVQCSLFEYSAGVGPNYYIGGLDVHKGRGWTVRDNVFTGIQSPASSVAEHAVHFWNNSQDNTVERNVIQNCDRGIGFGLGTSANHGGIIRNNFICNDGSAAFSDVGIGLESSPDTKVYNNTVIVGYTNAIEYRFAQTVNVEILNNLTNKPIRSRDGGTGTLATNYSNAVESWFVDASTGNLRLARPEQSVVDRGSDVSTLVPDDIDKTLRPKGSGYDIGAHEYLAPASVEGEPLPDDVTIFPNPGYGLFTVRAITDNLTLDVRDILGRNVHRARLIGENRTIDLRGWPGGVYVFVVSQGNRYVKQQLVVIL